jgi:hypothetical protein
MGSIPISLDNLLKICSNIVLCDLTAHIISKNVLEDFAIWPYDILSKSGYDTDGK